MTDGGSWTTETDALLAVVAHGLIGSMSSIGMALNALSTRELDAERRDELLALACRQTEHVQGVLRDLIAGVPPEVTDALNTLAIPSGFDVGREGFLD